MRALIVGLVTTATLTTACVDDGGRPSRGYRMYGQYDYDRPDPSYMAIAPTALPATPAV